MLVSKLSKTSLAAAVFAVVFQPCIVHAQTLSRSPRIGSTRSVRTAVRGRTRTRGRSPLSTSLSTPSPTSAFGEGPFTKGLFADPPVTGLRDRANVRTPDRAITHPDFSTAPKAFETLPLPSVDVSAYVADETAAIS